MNSSNIHNNYFKRPKGQAEVAKMRKKVVRLNIILEALNEAFTFRTERIIHSRRTGQGIAKIEKKPIGLIAPLLVEACRIIEGGKGPEININNWQNVVESANKLQKLVKNKWIKAKLRQK